MHSVHRLWTAVARRWLSAKNQTDEHKPGIPESIPCCVVRGLKSPSQRSSGHATLRSIISQTDDKRANATLAAMRAVATRSPPSNLAGSDDVLRGRRRCSSMDVAEGTILSTLKFSGACVLCIIAGVFYNIDFLMLRPSLLAAAVPLRRRTA
jgi:hypothetical protein